MIETPEEISVGWVWRNCRSLEFSLHVEICPWQWEFGMRHWDSCNFEEWKGWLLFGPIALGLLANIGNVSSENRFRAWFGLSECEAWVSNSVEEFPGNSVQKFPVDRSSGSYGMSRRCAERMRRGGRHR